MGKFLTDLTKILEYKRKRLIPLIQKYFIKRYYPEWPSDEEDEADEEDEEVELDVASLSEVFSLFSGRKPFCCDVLFFDFASFNLISFCNFLTIAGAR